MEHVFSVECQRFVPNPFALVHVAAARARAIQRGAPPRLQIENDSLGPLALREIAAGAFASGELERLLGQRHDFDDLPDTLDVTEGQLLTAAGGSFPAEFASYAGKETLTQEWAE